MSKSQLKKQINKLLIGGAGPEVVFYFDGSYKIGQCGRLTDITQPEAIQYMRAGAELIHIVEDCRKWDDKHSAFTGPEPVHKPLAGVPGGTKIINLICCFPPSEAAAVFFE